MEYHAADKLHVVVHHIPFYLVAPGKPAVVIYGFVAVNFHEILSGSGEVAVKLCGGYLYSGACCKTCGSLSECGKYCGEMLVELVLDSVEDVLFMLINLVPEWLTFFKRKLFDFNTVFGHSILVSLYGSLDVGTDIGYSLTEFIIAHCLHFWHKSFNRINNRLYFLKVTL